jgi:hypothetical protein
MVICFVSYDMAMIKIYAGNVYKCPYSLLVLGHKWDIRNDMHFKLYDIHVDNIMMKPVA